MPPLRLQPLFKHRPWGGRRLANQWHKPEHGTSGWAESWEVVDLGEDQSRILGGPFDGKLLHDLVREQPRKLLGRHADLKQFPLLFKFLDTAETLSVQVHPNDAQAAVLAPGHRGKSEAWVVLAADSTSQLFIGLKPGIDRVALERHLAAGTVERCLHSISAKAGDVYFVPAGTVHAIGSGISLAELQQPSDLTLRLFDWNRRDAQRRMRALHVELALQCIDFTRGGILPLNPRELQANPAANASPTTRHEELIRCEFFVWRRHTSTAQSFSLLDENCCRVLSLIEGSARVNCTSGVEELSAGHSLLIPAECRCVEIEPKPNCVLLEALPVDEGDLAAIIPT